MKYRRKSRAVFVIPAVLLVVGLAVAAGVYWMVSHQTVEVEKKKPDELLMEYMQYISDGNYEAMYGMLDGQSHLNISMEDFVDRNRKIYEGIEASNIRIEVRETEVREDGTEAVNYQTTMDTVAGEISFFNQVDFHEEEVVSGEGEDGSGNEQIGRAHV